MQTKIKLLSTILFIIAFTTANAHEKNKKIYLDYANVSGKQTFYQVKPRCYRGQPNFYAGKQTFYQGRPNFY